MSLGCFGLITASSCCSSPSDVCPGDCSPAPAAPPRPPRAAAGTPATLLGRLLTGPAGRAAAGTGRLAVAPTLELLLGHPADDDGDVARALADAGGRPRARGRKRRMVRPSSAQHADTTSSSAIWSSLCSALAMAERSSFRTTCAASRSENRRICSALRTSAPRMRSSTARALVADMRMWRAVPRLPGRSLVRTGRGHRYRRPPRSWPAWKRKVRVGANSPSLCPTMDSVMYTGTCLRPSWTAMVCPTISGMIVDRRDQVLMTRFSPCRSSRRPS